MYNIFMGFQRLRGKGFGIRGLQPLLIHMALLKFGRVGVGLRTVVLPLHPPVRHADERFARSFGDQNLVPEMESGSRFYFRGMKKTCVGIVRPPTSVAHVTVSRVTVVQMGERSSMPLFGRSYAQNCNFTRGFFGHRKPLLSTGVHRDCCPSHPGDR